MNEHVEALRIRLKVRFIELEEGATRPCKQCCFYGFSICKNLKCTSRERLDGKNGYYIKY